MSDTAIWCHHCQGPCVHDPAALRAMVRPAATTPDPWQPIATAPKEPVLLYRPGMIASERVAVRRAADWCGESCCPSAKPTHWMPLPDPPTALREGRASSTTEPK
jgi:hypothetical protein